MKSITLKHAGRKALLLGLAISLFTACQVTFIPDYDQAIAAQIEETAKTVDRFYLMMLETTTAKDEGRSFDLFAEQYVNIEVELTSLYNKNKVRPLNENSTRICEITLELWQKYKEEHREDNSLSDGLIKLNRNTFEDLFYAMLVAERAKDIVNNPPQ